MLNINNETRLKCITLNHHCGRRFRWWCITSLYCVVTVNVEWFRWFYRCPSEHFSTSEIQLTSKTVFYILLFSVCVEITLIHYNICWCLTDDLHWAGLSYDIWRHFYMRKSCKQHKTDHYISLTMLRSTIMFHSHILGSKNVNKTSANKQYNNTGTFYSTKHM